MSSSFSIGGIASGLDTSAIINELMFAARAPVRRLESSKTAEQRELTAWEDLGTRLGSLEDALKTFTNGTALQAVSSSSSDETVVRAQAQAGALPGTYSFRVTSMAAAHQSASAGFPTTATTVGEGTAVVSRGAESIGIDQLDAAELTSGVYEIEVLSIDGKDATVVFDGIEQVVKAKNGKLTAADGAELDLDKANLVVGEATLVVAQTTAQSTLVDVSSQLNASGSPVRSQLIDTGDGTANPWRLVLTSTDTGTDNALELDLGGLAGFAGGFTDVRAASDAVLTLGESGLTITRSGNTIDDVFDGVTLDLRSANPGADVEVTVNADVDGRVGAIRSVVDQVNAVLTKIRTDSGYDVETGRGGPFVGNYAARQLSSDLQSALGQVVPGGDLVLLGQVGITITNDGTFELDETTLSSALTTSPDDVERLLIGDAATGSDGVFDNLLATVERSVDLGGLVASAKSSSESTIDELDDTIANHEVRLDQVEARYARQFAALEALLGQMQSQSSYLASALAQLPR